MRGTREERAAELAAREVELLAGRVVTGAPLRGEPATDTQEPMDLSGLMQNAQVQAMISAAVAAQVAPILTQLQAARADAGTAPASPTGDLNIAQSIAVAIQQMVEQGRPNARKTLAPEIMAQREAAKERMIATIIEANARGDTPHYELKATVYLDEQQIAPTWVSPVDRRQRPRQIYWPGVPNQAMRPMNPAAEAIYQHFLDWIGSAGARPGARSATSGLRILDQIEGIPNVGDGLGGRRSLIIGEQPATATDNPIHVLGTIAEPLRPSYAGGSGGMGR